MMSDVFWDFWLPIILKPDFVRFQLMPLFYDVLIWPSDHRGGFTYYVDRFYNFLVLDSLFIDICSRHLANPSSHLCLHRMWMTLDMSVPWKISVTIFLRNFTSCHQTIGILQGERSIKLFFGAYFHGIMLFFHRVRRTTDSQWRHKSKKSEMLGQCGMLRSYLKIWDWDWIFGRALKLISSWGVRSPWVS